MTGLLASTNQDALSGLTNLPEGFRYKADLLDLDLERSLIQELERLDFAPFQFHGFEGKRRVVSFGWRYDFNGGGLQSTDAFPAFLNSGARCSRGRVRPRTRFAATGAADRICAGRIHRLAQGPARLR